MLSHPGLAQVNKGDIINMSLKPGPKTSRASVSRLEAPFVSEDPPADKTRGAPAHHTGEACARLLVCDFGLDPMLQQTANWCR